MNNFKGFNEDQTKKIAQKLGFNGPLEEFNSFLESNPKASQSFMSMVNKATSYLQQPKPGFSSGGVVTPPKPTTTPPVTNTVPFATAGSNVKDVVKDQPESPTASAPTGALAKAVPIVGKPDELIKTGVGALPSKTPTATATLPSAINPNQPTSTYGAATAAGAVDKVAATAPDATGTVSSKSQVTAQTSDPTKMSQLKLEAPQISAEEKKEATVQEQLTNLMKDFEGGKTPPWAAGVLRGVNASMAARGLDTSSVAGQAAVQAAMEAATAIATTDAQLLGQTNMANLDVRKSKMLSDAAAMSAMDLKNLDNRQQAAVLNAQSFLQMDFKNLDIKAQNDVLSFQARVNALLSDQAQENASRQFNATSENQTKQFFANLAASIDVQRAEISTETSKFNSSLQNQREQFNATNALVIEQANTAWRQAITTTNNATQNLTNQLNAKTIAGMNENAFNAMIQLERDEMNYVNDALNRAFTAGESELERKNRTLIASLDREAQRELAKLGYEFEAGSNFGGALVGFGGKVVDEVFSWF